MGHENDDVDKSPNRVKMTIGEREERQSLFSEDGNPVERPATIDPVAMKKASLCRFTVQNIERGNENSPPMMERSKDLLTVEMEEPIGENHRSHSSSRFKCECRHSY